MKKQRKAIRIISNDAPPPAPADAVSTTRAIAVIVLISAFFVWPLFLPATYATHDGLFHLVRISQFITAFRDGQYLVRWLPDFMGGYGLPVFVIYPPLPPYLVTALSLLGLDLVTAYKLVMAISVPLSGAAMFFFAREFFAQRAAILAAAAYMLAPYRFIDIYVRGAFNECLSFPFIPLIFLGVKRTAEGKFGGLPLLALSLAGLTMTHNPVSLILLPFIIVYGLIAAWGTVRWKSIGFILLGLLLGLGLSSFHWLVAYVEKNYTVIGTSRGALSGFFDFNNHFIRLNDLLSPYWGYGYSGKYQIYSMPFQLGDFLVVCIGLSLFAVRWLQNPQTRRTVVFSQVMLMLSVFMMFDVSLPIWARTPLIAFVQFPWRFLNLALFPAAFLTGALPEFIRCRPRWGRPALLTLLFITPMLTFAHMVTWKDKYMHAFYISETVFMVLCAILILLGFRKTLHLPATAAAVATLTAIVAAIPIGAVPLHHQLWGKPEIFGKRPMERALLSHELLRDIPPGTANGNMFLPKTVINPPLEPVKEKMEIVKGYGAISSLAVRSAGLSCTAYANTEITARINTFFFPGWTVYSDGVRKPPELDSSGRMLFTLPPGKHAVEVRFEDTPVRRVARIASLCSLLLLAGSALWQRRFNRI